MTSLSHYFLFPPSLPIVVVPTNPRVSIPLLLQINFISQSELAGGARLRKFVISRVYGEQAIMSLHMEC